MNASLNNWRLLVIAEWGCVQPGGEVESTWLYLTVEAICLAFCHLEALVSISQCESSVCYPYWYWHSPIVSWCQKGLPEHKLLCNFFRKQSQTEAGEDRYILPTLVIVRLKTWYSEVLQKTKQQEIFIFFPLKMASQWQVEIWPEGFPYNKWQSWNTENIAYGMSVFSPRALALSLNRGFWIWKYRDFFFFKSFILSLGH